MPHRGTWTFEHASELKRFEPARPLSDLPGGPETVGAEVPPPPPRLRVDGLPSNVSSLGASRLVDDVLLRCHGIACIAHGRAVGRWGLGLVLLGRGVMWGDGLRLLRVVGCS